MALSRLNIRTLGLAQQGWTSAYRRSDLGLSVSCRCLSSSTRKSNHNNQKSNQYVFTQHGDLKSCSTHLHFRSASVLPVRTVSRTRPSFLTGCLPDRQNDLCSRQSFCTSTRSFMFPSLKRWSGKADVDKDKDGNPAETQPAAMGVMDRFKNAYKQYGKTLIAVHVATSIVWFGSFYYAAASGVDVVPYLEKWGASEMVIKPFRDSSIGDVAVAYLMYKLATPARYTVTIVGTQQMARYLKTTGYIQPIPEGDTIRELVKEGSQEVRHKMKSTAAVRRKKFNDAMNVNKHKITTYYKTRKKQRLRH